MSARFAIVYPDRVREVDSSMPPEALAALVGQALDLLAVFEIPVQDVQIWQKDDALWHPVFGADHEKPTEQLRTEQQTTMRHTDQHYVRLGQQAVRLYRLWQWQRKSYQTQMNKNAAANERSAVQFQSPGGERMAVLSRKIALIDDIVQDFSDPRLRTVFDYSIHQHCSAQRIATDLHYSLSTVQRSWRQAKMGIGHGLESRLSPAQLSDFRAEIERSKWSVARLLHDD